MRVIRYSLLVLAAAWALSAVALASSLKIYGNTRAPGKDTGPREVWTWFFRKGDLHLGGLGGSDGYGNWTCPVPGEGEYTLALPDRFILRPGVIVSSDRFNRVDMILSYAYDNKGDSATGPHREIGQTFVSTGRDIILVSAYAPGGTIITLKEDGPQGKQLASLPSRLHFTSGELPVEPGRRYYIGWTRADGEQFEMQRVSTDNPYPQGTAFYDGEPQPDVDLGMRLTVMPPGQRLNNYGHGSVVYKWAEDGYGQTFTAKGDSLGMIRFGVAYGDKPFIEPLVRILRGGPGGRQVGPTKRAHIAIYARGEVPLTPGEVYYIEITEPSDPPGLNIWVEAARDVYPGGHLYVNGEPEPDRDLAFDLVEYVADNMPPPPVSNIRNIPGDGVMKIVFDAPESADICRVVVRRTIREMAKSPTDGEAVADMPITAKGTYWVLDRGLKNDQDYVYTFFTVDAVGNCSEPASGSGCTAAQMVMPVNLINGDFTEGANGLAPHGWGIIARRGGAHFVQGDSPDGKSKAVGWSTNNVAHDMVLWQRVPVVPGRRYLLSANTYRREPWNNGNANQLTAVGIDPTGRLDLLSPCVVWSPAVYRSAEWRQQRVACTADGDVLTVYLRGRAQYGGQGMSPLFANVELQDVTTLGGD